MEKISFLGDIMCEKPFLKAANRSGSYDFSAFLSPCKDLFSASDYIIGNLETPCDPDSDLTKDMFVFNAPTEFLRAIRAAGVDFVTTATNHCLDRGSSGLKNTIKALDNAGLAHTGTFEKATDKKYFVVQLKDGTKVAILSYTYGTNYMDNGVLIPEEEYYEINHLTPLYSGRNKAYDEMNYSLRARLTRMIPRGLRIKINTALGRPLQLSFKDKIQQDDLSESRLKEIADTIKQARSEADLVFICPHFGGQFNTEPGSYVSAFTDFFQENRVDSMIGNHPHVAQKIEQLSYGMIAAYSLGNISMSLSTPYVDRSNLPDYSLMFHIYVEEGHISKISFSILVECEHNGFITVYPLSKLYEESRQEDKLLIERNCNTIVNRVLQKNEAVVPILDEYSIEV